MSTRGFSGIVVDGVEKIIYNDGDSYPAGYGLLVLGWAREWMADEPLLRERARALRMMEPEDEITAPAAAAMAPHLPEWAEPLEVGERWEDVEIEGDLETFLKGGYAVGAPEFPYDSLFAEWGYLIDLDARVFEVYRGFQKSPHTKGRFAQPPKEPQEEGGKRYHPVALIMSWPLDALPNGDEFIALTQAGTS